MKLKKLIPIAAFSAMGLLSMASQADDTDIYLETNSTLGHNPLVMFHMEYTSNLASTICSGVTNANSEAALIADGCDKMVPLAGYFGANDIVAGQLTLFDMLKAVMRKTVTRISGIKVGYMMSHNDTTEDPDGDGIQTCIDPNACSNGGYIMLGFRELGPIPAGFDNYDPLKETLYTYFPNTGDTAGHYAFLNMLDNLPEPQGNLSHANQNKELYFEFFRYLTGQSVLNAFNGYWDFGTNDWINIGSEKDCIAPNGKESETVPCPASVDPDTTLEGTGTLHLGPDLNIMEVANKRYISPLVQHCSKVFVINILDGGGNQANSAELEIAAPLDQEGMALAVEANDTGFVQMVGWLHDIDLANLGEINGLDLEDKQNVTSYFLAFQPQQVNDAAYAGGTSYAYELSEDPQSVLDHLESVFDNILSVSTTFVSASIPVNVFNRSEVIDNVYIALFQTDEDKQPAWVGNVKKLKLDIRTYDLTSGGTEDRIEVVDANDLIAITADGDGRIEYGALTFWTDPLGFDVVDHNPNAPDYEVQFRDGRSVDRGGAGQQIPGFLDGQLALGNATIANTTGGRQLFTEPATFTNGSPTSLRELGLTGTIADDTLLADMWPIVTADLSHWGEVISSLESMEGFYPLNIGGITGTYSKDKDKVVFDPTTNKISSGDEVLISDVAKTLLAYMRGFDVRHPDFNLADAMNNVGLYRRWVFGDSLHSRPYPVNYGARPGYSQDNPDIRILVGSNDGYMRMLRNTTTAAGEDGAEVWAFMPQAVMGIQKQLLNNADGSEPRHPYGVDGAPVIYWADHNQNGTIEGAYTDPDTGVYYPDDIVWAFFGLRRGGQAYYALDISNPDSPKLMWRIDPGVSGFDELGYTFSTPAVHMLKWGTNTYDKPVLIFGGGYDLNKDADGVGTDDTVGRAVYVVDAETGELVWKASHTKMVDSIPSRVSAVDTDGDQMIDRAYVGDTGGNVWRLDLVNTSIETTDASGNTVTNPANTDGWTVTQILQLGRHNPDATFPDDDRRFFHAPDFVPARDEAGVFDAIIIGSGDRAEPLSLDTQDYMFMFKDRETLSGYTSTYDPDTQHGPYILSELTDVTDTCLQVDPTCLSITNGWAMRLIDKGEKSLASPLTLSGIIYFNTYVPVDFTAEFSCGPQEGTGWMYAVSLQEGNAVYDYDTSNNTNDQALFIEDRREQLLSGGIPSENVYINYREDAADNDPSLEPGTQDRYVQCIMSTDLRCANTDQRAAWRLYWYLEE